MKQVCKCHGVSGSCSVKVCWNVMPDFRVIGNELVKRYNLATQIKDDRIRNRVEKLQIITSRRSVRDMSETKHLKDKLLFVDKSPNFCQQNQNYVFHSEGRFHNQNQAKQINDNMIDYLTSYLGDKLIILENEDRMQQVLNFLSK